MAFTCFHNVKTMLTDSWSLNLQVDFFCSPSMHRNKRPAKCWLEVMRALKIVFAPDLLTRTEALLPVLQFKARLWHSRYRTYETAKMWQ